MWKQNLKRKLSFNEGPVRTVRRKQGKKQIQSVIRRFLSSHAEAKELDTAAAAVVVVNGYTNSLNSIAEGTDYTQRIGRHITPKYIVVDYWIQGASSASQGYFDAWYLSLVWDKQSDSGSAAYNTIYDMSAGNGYGQPFKATSTYKDRFRILKEERGVIQNTDDGVAGSIILGNFTGNIRGKMFVKLEHPRYQCEFGVSGAAVPTVGNLLLCFGSNNNTGATTTSCSLTYNARFVFTDM